MPEVSIIVPVYNVESYLENCLDSILRQSFRDFELIAVNDCSPDKSSEILYRYQETDPRVRVVALQNNVGVGLARNAGLEVASGRYIWFLDGDDTIAPGSLAKIMDRARATDAELVLFGWVRSYQDGMVKAGSGEALLAAAPKSFNAIEWPDILRLLHVPWNKLIRRDLLERMDLRFASGLYEDVSFSVPLLAAAARITTLSEVIVYYRRATSNATLTAGEQHLDAVSHWDRALTLVDRIGGDRAGGASIKMRTVLFQRMIWHCAYVLLKSGRVPVQLRPEYMRRLRSLYHKHHPGRHYRSSDLSERLRHWTIGIGSLFLLRLHWKLTGPKRSAGQER